MKEREVTVRGEYLLRLERGEDVFSSITEFCKRKGILSGSFRAIGAIEQAKIGYYDLSSKKYGSKDYPDAMEVASMTGNVAQVDPIRERPASNGAGSTPFVHCHAVLSGIALGSENETVGGHVFECKVAVTLEVHLVAFNESISRELDNDIGLKLLDL